jgi:hypothetical protein
MSLKVFRSDLPKKISPIPLGALKSSVLPLQTQETYNSKQALCLSPLAQFDSLSPELASCETNPLESAVVIIVDFISNLILMSSDFIQRKLFELALNRHHPHNPSGAQSASFETPFTGDSCRLPTKGFAPTFSFKKFIPNCQRTMKLPQTARPSPDFPGGLCVSAVSRCCDT